MLLLAWWELAAVVGHEIAHVEFLHSQERYGQQTLGQLGAVAAGVAVGSQCDERDTRCRQRALALAEALAEAAA